MPLGRCVGGLLRVGEGRPPPAPPTPPTPPVPPAAPTAPAAPAATATAFAACCMYSERGRAEGAIAAPRLPLLPRSPFPP